MANITLQRVGDFVVHRYIRRYENSEFRAFAAKFSHFNAVGGRSMLARALHCGTSDLPKSPPAQSSVLLGRESRQRIHEWRIQAVIWLQSDVLEACTNTVHLDRIYPAFNGR